MDPNNQAVNLNQNNQQQNAPSPQNPVETTSGVQYQNPKINTGNKTVLLLVVLLVVVIGLAVYLFFVNINNNSSQNVPVPTSTPAPPTSTPTLQPEDDLNIEDPEVDIKALDDDAATL